MTPSLLSPTSLLAAAGLLLAASTGCAPVREQVESGIGGGGDYYQSAFVALDPWSGSEYELAYVFLVDSDDMSCTRIRNQWGIDWWNLSSDVGWVQAWVYKGAEFEWSRTYRSQYAWNQGGEFDYRRADFFSGTYGSGGYATGDDDDDVPPPVGDGGEDPDGDDNSAREQEGDFGNSVEHEDDTLVFTAWSTETVRGFIESEEGSWSFDAVNCGFMDGEVVIGVTGDDAADAE